MERRREKKESILRDKRGEERIAIFSHVDWIFTREKRIGNFNINARTFFLFYKLRGKMVGNSIHICPLLGRL